MMEPLLLGLWVLCLLLPFAIRRRERPVVVIAVLPVVLPDPGAAQKLGSAPDQASGEAWLRRQLEGLEKEGTDRAL
jgi:hypothetical protein